MLEKIILPNEVLLRKAVRTVAEGKTAIIPVKGQSMYPFIHGNKDCVELSLPINIKVGDIVLAEVSPGKFLLHRVFRFKEGEGVILMGDGNIHNMEHCLRRDIKAKALIVINGHGKRKRLDTPFMRFMAFIWKKCLPIRGILLRMCWKL